MRRLLMAAFLMLGGCAAPLSVERLSPQAAYRALERSALAENALSEATRTTLRRHGLLERLGPAPDETIAALHARVVGTPEAWSELFALAETSYLRGRETQSQARYLAAAVYAYAFLFPEPGSADRPNPFDPRLRQAADLYNLALSAAFSSETGGPATFRSGRYPLPFGTIDIAVDESSFSSGGRSLTSFQPTATLAVKGLQNKYRAPGIGAPVAASVAPPPADARGIQVAPRLRIPSTALLEVPQARQQLAGGALRGTLAIHTIFGAESVQIGGQRVPLEFDQTAARAYSLVESRAWRNEYRGFLHGDLLQGGPEDTRLAALEPHRRGRMPVVLIHGTASSPFRWADMVNDLAEDARIRENFEFWFFAYATGNPIPFSALLLRESLQAAVEGLGGEAADPALGRMVLVGHSQGGLLARMVATDSGTRWWDAVSRRPLDELRLDPSNRDLLRRALFVEHLPQVERVVFIATPHRGSYLTEFSATRLISRLITLPAALAGASVQAFAGNADAFTFDISRWRPGSLSGMTPGSPLIQAISQVPVSPAVRAHSIIPTLGDGPLAERSDGVVRHASAHLEGVESELVVASSHSVQSNSAAIEEVRRILLLQLAEPCPRGACRAAPAVAQAR